MFREGAGSAAPGECPQPPHAGGSAVALTTANGGCVPVASFALFTCAPDATPVIVRDGSVSTRRRLFLGGRFSVPVAALPPGARAVGSTPGGTVYEIPGDERWLFTSQGPFIERWLLLPRHLLPAPPTVSFIGDSITDGASADLTTTLADWTVHIDAVVGRSSFGGVGPALIAGATVPPPDAVVVELGTNDFDIHAFRTNLHAIVDAMPSTPLVVWQTVHSPLPSAPAVNRAIHAQLGAYPNTVIADWEHFVRDAQLGDGIHPLAGDEHLEGALVAPILREWWSAAHGVGPTACVPPPAG